MMLSKVLDDNKNLNMTEGKPFGLIMRFALPLFIGSVFQQVYNMVDSIVVGQFVGKNALAAVGGCGAAYNLIIALVTGFSTAASVLLAQAYGSGEREQVQKSFATSIAMIMATGVALMAVGLFSAEGLLYLLGTPSDVLPDATVYLRTICAGVLATSLYNAMSSCLRAVGDSVTPLVALVMASLLNVALDLLFVVSFGMGVFGVAIATVISQLISGIYCLVYALCRTEAFRFRRKELDGSLFLDRAIIREVFRIGIPAALSSAIVIISAMFMQRAVNQFGSDAAAAYAAGNRTEQIFMCLSFSIGMAIGTFCGQNIGAREYERVKEGMRCGYRINMIYTVVMGVIMFFFAPQVIEIFTNSRQVVEIGVPMVRITAFFAPVLGFVFIFQNFLRSASDIAPTIWMSGCEIGARSVLSFVFAALAGYFGVWWATPIGWTGSALIGLLRYRSGKWKMKCEAAQKRLKEQTVEKL